MTSLKFTLRVPLTPASVLCFPNIWSDGERVSLAIHYVHRFLLFTCISCNKCFMDLITSRLYLHLIHRTRLWPDGFLIRNRLSHSTENGLSLSLSFCLFLDRTMVSIDLRKKHACHLQLPFSSKTLSSETG